MKTFLRAITSDNRKLIYTNFTDLMRAKQKAFESAIMKEYELKTDESKRIGEKKDITSMDGTFRKLELD